MAKVQHTCTGCVPIDASIIDVYVTLVQTNQFVTDAETGRALAEAARVTAENARTATFSEDHSRAVTDHTNAQTAINNANAAAAAANAAGITSASASVDSNVGTPSVDVSLVNKQLSLSFHNIKGEKGEKGDRGDGAIPVVNDLVTGGTAAALSAEMGKTLNTTKQATLVSGTNIKTVNGESLLGEGNIVAGDPNAVKYVAQTLTDAQKAQARTNIDAYQKPSTGIPATDLASAAQTSLGKADTAYQKPSGGIPKTDLDSGVQGSLDLADSAIQARPMGEVDPTITPADYATTEELSELEAKVDYKRLSFAGGTPGSYITLSGGVGSWAAGYISDYIAVKAGAEVSVYCASDSDALVIAFYNTDKVFVATGKVAGLGATSMRTYTSTAPEDGFVRCYTDKTRISTAWTDSYILYENGLAHEYDLENSLSKLSVEVKKTYVPGISDNLFDKSQEFRNGYITNTGEFAAIGTGDYLATYTIPIKRNTWYTIGIRGIDFGLSSIFFAARSGDNVVNFDTLVNGATQSVVYCAFGYPSSPAQIKVDAENPGIVFTVKFTSSQDARDYIVLIEGEVSDFPTEYKEYNLYIPESKIDPSYRNNVNARITALEEGISADNLFHYDNADGGESYIRSPFDSTRDLKVKLIVSRESSLNNNPVFNFSTVSLITKIGGEETIVQEAGDDICPARYNGIYIGANHADSELVKVTATAHGKTAADIGSIWSNGTKQGTLVGIIDANTLMFLGPMWQSYPIFAFDTSMFTQGGTLSHISGATNTGNITIASVSYGQYYSAMKKAGVRIIIDGNQVTNSGDYYFKHLDICEDYNVMNPASVVSKIREKVGTFTETPNPNSIDGVDIVANHSIVYGFDSASEWRITTTFTALQNINLGYFGFTQQGIMTGNNVKMYIPKALPISGIDFRTIANYNSLQDSINITSEYWEKSNFPPDRWLQMSENIGLHSGFLFDYGVGGENRKDLINNAFYLYTSRKVYPHGVDNKITMNAGDSYSAVVWRSYLDRASIDANGVISVNVFEHNGKCYVYADYNSSGVYEITIPDNYVGRGIEVFEKSDNLTLMSSVATGKILVKVATASPMYGYLVAQIK